MLINNLYFRLTERNKTTAYFGKLLVNFAQSLIVRSSKNGVFSIKELIIFIVLSTLQFNFVLNTYDITPVTFLAYIVEYVIFQVFFSINGHKTSHSLLKYNDICSL